MFVYTRTSNQDAWTTIAGAFTDGPNQSQTQISQAGKSVSLAHASSSYKASLVAPAGVGIARYTNTRVGWSVGGGVEWKFAPEWSLKAEGLYYYLGDVTLRATPVSYAIGGGWLYPAELRNALAAVNPAFLPNIMLSVANAPVTRIRFDGYVLRLGVNHQFSWTF